ncbi:trypsin inhibitor-like [Phragmites australis]|uniref:trypsin inhibitor-like n=1 Tax=Phragmites australis TaxID=29695 RepID=UPI002D77CCB9|nr:trypsin inhibitor-like [Phragmites australis]
MAKTPSASILLLLPLVFLLLSIVCKAAAGDTTPCTRPPCSGKQSWPELVGKDQNTAYTNIRNENPQVTDVVYLISNVLGHVLRKNNVLGAAGDDDFCCNRVVVVLGALASGGEGVIKVPRVG